MITDLAVAVPVDGPEKLLDSRELRGRQGAQRAALGIVWTREGLMPGNVSLVILDILLELQVIVVLGWPVLLASIRLCLL